MSTTTEQLPEAQPEIKQPWHQKYSLYIIGGLVVVLTGVIIYGAVRVAGKGTANPTVVKRDTLALRFLVNDLGVIAQSVGFKDKLSDGGYVYEVITGIDTVKDKEGKTQMDTVAFQKGHYLMDTVKDVLNQPILDTIKNGKQVLIDSVTHKPEVKVRLKYRLVPAVRPHFEYRNPKNVEEIPLSIHLFPPHP
jgi:hypothetical protein